MFKILQKISICIIILGIYFIPSIIFSQQWVNAGFVSNPGLVPSISVSSPVSAWIADGSGNTPKVFRTTNAGLTWLQVPVGGISNELYCVWSINDNAAFVGEGVVSGNANLYKTTNAGLNWVSVMQTGNNRGYFNGLAFTKTNGGLFGLAIAERVYRSSNNGTNWVELNPGVNGVSNAQNSLMIIDNNFYGFGLNNGSARVRLTTDNSSTWTTQQISVSGSYTSAIAFHTNKLLGIAATSTSLPNISRTTDGGNTWSTVNIGSGVTGTCYLNWVPQTPVIYILGANGGIKRSTDNGLTWVLTPVPNGVTNLTYFDFVQGNNIVYGYAVSSNGDVIKLTDTLSVLTGSINGNTETPSAYSLEQNYPNPFNPSTGIRYSVPKSSFVNITVFDALGNETETLVNERKETGNYEAFWNASRFASGLYFYRIQADGFSETKKMILLK